MIKLFYIVWVCVFILVLFACKKEPVETNNPEINNINEGNSIPDFRECFIGDFSCMEYYNYPYADTSGHIINAYDLTDSNAILTIGLHNDSDIVISGVSWSQYAYFSDTNFYYIHNGYVSFISPDSIKVRRGTGPQTTYYYYGNKISSK